MGTATSSISEVDKIGILNSWLKIENLSYLVFPFTVWQWNWSK